MVVPSPSLISWGIYEGPEGAPVIVPSTSSFSWGILNVFSFQGIIKGPERHRCDGSQLQFAHLLHL